MQFNSVRASAKEGVSRLERVDDFQCVQEPLDIWVGFHLLVPGTLPLDVHVITALSQGLLFLDSGLVDLLQSTVVVADGNLLRWVGNQLRQPCHRHPWNSNTVGR